MKTKEVLRYSAIGGVIAALYVAATALSAALGLAFGPIQFRISEALCILPVFFPEAIPGLAVGCFLSNLTSPYGMLDVVFGTAATLLAAILTRVLRKVAVRGIPILSLLAPVVCNMIIVGAEITLFFEKEAGLAAFLIAAVEVGVGELAVMLLLGIGLFFIFKKIKFSRNG